jgi:DNA invertase Pin-like site-specific DNA recombinase
LLIGYLNLPLDQLAGGVSEPQNALLAAGAARLFIDIDVSPLGSAQTATPQLAMALAELQPGDGLISLSVHTLARTIDGLLDVNARLLERHASLRVLRMPGGLSLDTAMPEGRAILGALALMSGMQMGVPMPAVVPPVTSHAVEAPLPARSRGRPATAGAQAGEVTKLHAQGVRAVDIAATLGIGRASVYRILSHGGIGDTPVRRPAAPSRSAAIAAAAGGRFDPFNGR